MNMRVTGSYPAGLTSPVDKRIGDAFPIVEEVYRYLKQLNYLAENAEKFAGKQVEFRSNSEEKAIEWRYENEDWIVLVSFSELVGININSIEARIELLIETARQDAQHEKQDAVMPVVAGSAGWDHAISLDRPSIVMLTLTVPTCTLAVQATCQAFRLALVQGTGANKVTWPSNVRWPNGVPPVLSYTQGRIDLFEFLSPDADGQWFGCFASGGF